MLSCSIILYYLTQFYKGTIVCTFHSFMLQLLNIHVINLCHIPIPNPSSKRTLYKQYNNTFTKDSYLINHFNSSISYFLHYFSSQLNNLTFHFFSHILTKCSLKLIINLHLYSIGMGGGFLDVLLGAHVRFWAHHLYQSVVTTLKYCLKCYNWLYHFNMVELKKNAFLGGTK